MHRFVQIKNIFLVESIAKENEHNSTGYKAEALLCDVSSAATGCFNGTSQLFMAVNEPELHGNDSCLSSVVGALRSTGKALLYGDTHQARILKLRTEVANTMFSSTHLKESQLYIERNLLADERFRAGLIPVDLVGSKQSKESNLANRYKSFIQANGAFGL
jgi:hypothetical protein